MHSRRSRIQAAMVLLAAAALVSACGNEDDELKASRTVERLLEAVERGDGASACAELTEEAADNLEGATGEPCDDGILKLEPSAEEVSDATVSITSAQVSLAAGGVLFLDETQEGWKVSALGCESRPGLPYDCQVEG